MLLEGCGGGQVLNAITLHSNDLGSKIAEDFIV